MSEHVEDLERRISNERRQIDRTLDELEHRLSPRRLLSQATGYLRNGSSSLLGSWGRTLKRNPLPLALTALGLTWSPSLRRQPIPLALTAVGLTLMARSAGEEASAPRYDDGQWQDRGDDRWRGGQAYEFGNGHARSGAGLKHPKESLLHRARMAAHDLKQQVNETAEAFAERVARAQGEVLGVARQAGESAGAFGARVSHALNEIAHEVREGVQEGASAAGDFAGRVSSAVGHGAHSVRDAVSQGGHYVKESVMHTAEQARELAHRGREQAGTFLREQPLMALALGVGFGALLGALLPTSPMERRNLGPMADRARDEMKQKARALGESAERVAGEAVEAVATGTERTLRSWEEEQGTTPSRSRH